VRIFSFLFGVTIFLWSLPAYATCDTDSPATCAIVGTTSSKNITPTAFSSPSPSCTKVTNNCSAAVMVPMRDQTAWSSFNTNHQSCVSLSSCGCSVSPWGMIADGASVTAYASQNPAGTCSSQTRTCSEGALSGSYAYSSCTPGCTVAWPSWLTNCSGSLSASVSGTVATVANTAAYHTGSETASCNAGTWSYSNQSCASTDCSSPCGTIHSGGTCTAYAASSVAYGSSCSSETRTCSNGTLSGSYGYSSCSVAAPASCTAPWGSTVAHGASVTAYASSSPAGPCSRETRACNNGTLSGSYTVQSCTAGCSAVSSTWSNCSGAVASASPGGVQTVSNTASGSSGSEVAVCSSTGSGTFSYRSVWCYTDPGITDCEYDGRCVGCQGTGACPSVDHGGSCISYEVSAVTTGDSCNNYRDNANCYNGDWIGPVGIYASCR
jgi:hypothetical protein